MEQQSVLTEFIVFIMCCWFGLILKSLQRGFLLFLVNEPHVECDGLLLLACKISVLLHMLFIMHLLSMYIIHTGYAYCFLNAINVNNYSRKMIFPLKI